MDTSLRGIDLIVSFEGKHKKLKDGRYQAYLDTLAKPAVWTLYCGLTRGITEGMICSEAEGQKMFAKELVIYEDAIERLVTVDLNQNQFDALVSWVYNCGVGALQNSTLLKLLNQGKYEAVPTQLMRWVNAGGKRYEGLARRRAAEGALFMEPVPPQAADVQEEPAAPAMPQRVEEVAVVKPGEVIAGSWTIKGAAIAFASTIVSGIQQSYDYVFGVAKEAGPEILTLKTTLSPFDALIKMTPMVLVVLTLAGLTIVVMRRLQAGREGKVG
jgi:lysozyme